MIFIKTLELTKDIRGVVWMSSAENATSRMMLMSKLNCLNLSLCFDSQKGGFAQCSGVEK